MASATSMAAVTLIRGADLVATPWKNGGGLTREVAAFPEGAGLDAFVWRVSIAEVAQAGPFSRFAGIDRTLALLSGAGMLLDEASGAGGSQGTDMTTHALTQALDLARFPGEAKIEARLVDGPTRDFNLMVRRGVALGETEVWRGESDHALSADVALLFCASGTVDVALGGGDHARAHTHTHTHTLTTNDTLWIDAPNALPCAITGAGALLAISILYAPR
ncbi:MAG TPA: HutD family protein [Paraburkholderia sp.]|nr:HutD family protein [Paraburkholderia sp.]